MILIAFVIWFIQQKLKLFDRPNLYMWTQDSKALKAIHLLTSEIYAFIAVPKPLFLDWIL